MWYDLKKGFMALWEGWKLLSEMNRRVYLIFPFFLYGFIIMGGLWTFSPWMSFYIDKATQFMSEFQFMPNFLLWLSEVMIWVLSIIFLVYALFLLSTVIISPFYSLMVEKVLMHLRAIPQENISWWEIIKRSLKMLWVSLIKAFVFFVVGIGLFVLSFIPGLNIITSFLFVMILVFDCVDFTFEVYLLNMRQRWSFFQGHIVEFSGMTVSMGLLLLIPGLNFILYPICIAGGASLVAQLQKNANWSPSRN